MAASNYSATRTYSTAFPIPNHQGEYTLSSSSSGTFTVPTIFQKSNGDRVYHITVNGDFIPGLQTTPLATNATTGFMGLQTCAGTPTGTPVQSLSWGTAPIVIDTTNNQLCYYNPVTSAWMSPGLAVLATATTSGSATVVTFNSIPQTYRNLRVVFTGAATAGGAPFINITVNNITTGTPYEYNRAGGGGAVFLGASATANAWLGCFLHTTVGNAASAEFLFPFYTSTTFFKTFQGLSGVTGAINYVTTTVQGHNSNTAAITRLDFTISSNAYVDGSQFVLYGTM